MPEASSTICSLIVPHPEATFSDTEGLASEPKYVHCVVSDMGLIAISVHRAVAGSHQS